MSDEVTVKHGPEVSEGVIWGKSAVGAEHRKKVEYTSGERMGETRLENHI